MLRKGVDGSCFYPFAACPEGLSQENQGEAAGLGGAAGGGGRPHCLAVPSEGRMQALGCMRVSTDNSNKQGLVGVFAHHRRDS